jgi:hypothetical protein
LATKNDNQKRHKKPRQPTPWKCCIIHGGLSTVGKIIVVRPPQSSSYIKQSVVRRLHYAPIKNPHANTASDRTRIMYSCQPEKLSAIKLHKP